MILVRYSGEFPRTVDEVGVPILPPMASEAAFLESHISAPSDPLGALRPEITTSGEFPSPCLPACLLLPHAQQLAPHRLRHVLN